MTDNPKLTSWDNRRRIGRFAWVMAWVGLVLGQMHALSRHATADGKADLDLPMTRAWAVPAADALRPLLDWSDPDTVYLTYGKIWLPVVAAFTLCALTVYTVRRPQGFEKWTWRVALTGYVSLVIGIFGFYWIQWTSYNVVGDIAFPFTIFGLIITVLGSSLLGIALLRAGIRPRVSAWFLAGSLPFFLVITQITSLGNACLPMMFAFGILGRELGRDPRMSTA